QSRQSIYSTIRVKRAVLDYASRHKDQLLYNQYLMGKNSITRGSRDSWTISPHKLDAVEAIANADRQQAQRGGGFGGGDGQRGGRGGNLTGEEADKYWKMLPDRKARNPRGYIIPSDQPDFLTAIKFLNTLIKNGIEVQRVDAALTLDGKTYPAG